MKLYLVRHGQSTANFTQTHSGWSQVPLTEKGREDAEYAGRYLRTLHFDRVYSSDLRRAVETAHFALPGCEPIQLPVLRERNVGSLAGRPFAECAAEYGDAYLKHRAALDFTAYGGENHEMHMTRVREFLAMLENDPADSVVAFTHGHFILCAVETVLNAQISHGLLRCSNGSVTILSFENGLWRLDTYGRV